MLDGSDCDEVSLSIYRHGTHSGRSFYYTK